MTSIQHQISGAKLNFRYSRRKNTTTKFEEWAKISYNLTTIYVNGYMSFSNGDASDISAGRRYTPSAEVLRCRDWNCETWFSTASNNEAWSNEQETQLSITSDIRLRFYWHSVQFRLVFSDFSFSSLCCAKFFCVIIFIRSNIRKLIPHTFPNDGRPIFRKRIIFERVTFV